MHKILFISICMLLASSSDVYQFQVPGLNGGPAIDFSTFRGKKILIVNTASNSPYTKQYSALESLYERFKDSLVVVAIPSNDFQHEPGSERAIQQFIADTYRAQFYISELNSVSGANQCSLYQWLATGGTNGAMSSKVTGDFQKYLLDTTGHVIGYFAGAVDPLDTLLVNRIIGK